MKKTIFIIIFLLLTSVVIAEEICGGTVRPNILCQMTTPSIQCSNYTYDLFYKNGSLLESGNLTQLNDTIYYFNFSQSKGTYLVQLCDFTTREVRVINGDDIMIAVVFGFITLIIYFFIMGFILDNVYVSFGSYFFSFIEMIIMFFSIWADFAGTDITSILRMNFLIIGLIGMGLLFYKLSENMIRLVASNKTKKSEGEWDSSW